MAHLKYYADERIAEKEAYDRKLPNSMATRIVIKKLARHYKLNIWDIRFTSGIRHSKAGANAGANYITININQNNFGMVCHEVAHIYHIQKIGRYNIKRLHCKYHRQIMKRMINYCKKKGWFEGELSRRLSPKEPKPEPTKDEMRQRKINKAREKIKRYESRIKLYTNKLRKARRSLVMLEKHLNKE